MGVYIKDAVNVLPLRTYLLESAGKIVGTEIVSTLIKYVCVMNLKT